MAEAISVSKTLEIHNQEALIRSAKDKLQKKKPLTRAEQKAIADVENQKLRQAAEGYLRALPKHVCVDTFGGSTKVWSSWAKEYDCPWGNGLPTIDAIELFKWTRDALARQLSYGGLKTNKSKALTDDYERRRKAAAAEEAEIKLSILKGEVHLAEDVDRDFQMWGAELRAAVENLSPEAQRVVNDALDRIHIAYEKHYETHDEEEATGSDTAQEQPPQDTANAS